LVEVSDTLGEQRDSVSSSGVHEEAIDTTVGFRSISVSMDGNHLAAGDSSGNLRIYDLNSLLLHSFQVPIDKSDVGPINIYVGHEC
jgi:WD40 repeat protein